MELRHLKYFLAVADELHFGRAAKRVHIAQPPLSQQIKQLEDELGAVLFDRTKRKVELTPAGSALVPHARAVLEQAHQCAEVVRLSANGERGALRIGYVEEAVHFVFPELLIRFRLRFPEVKIELLEMHSSDQISALEEGALDFGFGYSVSKSTKLASRTVLQGDILLAMPAGHPMARRPKIKLEHFIQDPFIFPSRETSPHLYDLLLAVCNSRDVVPRIDYTADHIYTVMGIVRAGLGVTLFPEFLQRDEWKGIAIRPLLGKSFELKMHVHWLKSRAKWTLHQNFMRAMRLVSPVSLPNCSNAGCETEVAD